MPHTHLAENDEDVACSLGQFGCRPGQYAEELGWTGEHVWHAHCVKLDADEIGLFARSGTGVAHCPGSNCQLGSGIAPVRPMRDAGVRAALARRLERAVCCKSLGVCYDVLPCGDPAMTSTAALPPISGPPLLRSLAGALVALAAARRRRRLIGFGAWIIHAPLKDINDWPAFP